MFSSSIRYRHLLGIVRSLGCGGQYRPKHLPYFLSVQGSDRIYLHEGNGKSIMCISFFSDNRKEPPHVKVEAYLCGHVGDKLEGLDYDGTIDSIGSHRQEAAGVSSSSMLTSLNFYLGIFSCVGEHFISKKEGSRYD